MAPRHSRDDDETESSVSPLRLVDPELPEDDFSPEVRAVLDAVGALHMAVIGWAAATVDTSRPHQHQHQHHAAPAPPGSGRHRR